MTKGRRKTEERGGERPTGEGVTGVLQQLQDHFRMGSAYEGDQREDEIEKSWG